MLSESAADDLLKKFFKFFFPVKEKMEKIEMKKI